MEYLFRFYALANFVIDYIILVGCSVQYTTNYSTVQHSTVQHSTLQYSTSSDSWIHPSQYFGNWFNTCFTSIRVLPQGN